MSSETSFYNLLLRSNAKIEAARAKRIVADVYEVGAAKLAEVRRQIRMLESEIERMEDLSVSNNTTTANRTIDFDGNAFWEKMTKLETQLELARVDLKIQQRLRDKYLGDIKVTDDGEPVFPEFKKVGRPAKDDE